VQWPDRKLTDVFIIGRVDGDDLPARIADFVRGVEQFKLAVG